MAYVKTQGGQTTYPYSIGQLRNDNPNVSFPKSVPDATLAAYGVYSVTVEAPPIYNASTQKIAENAHPTDVNGQWIVGWTITDMSPDELVAKASALEADVRMQRDRLLAASDWMALSDVTMSPAWVAYRQELRDITKQVDFPDNIVWPKEPVA
jgi:hypothetical protein